MLFANHLAVSSRATTLATAYRALTVAQAQIVLLPSTLLPSSAGWGRGLRATGYLISVRWRTGLSL
jgi:dTDP-4-amino-4,6-dideoxygalactose transaminase